MLDKAILPRKAKISKRPGCVQVAVVALLFTALAVLTACGNQRPPNPGTDASATPPSASAPPGTGSIDLSILLTESAGATPRQFRLVADGATAAPESTLPDPAAALAAVTLHGQDIFFPILGTPRACTQQYGGPQVAVVTGWFNGKEVNAAFKRTDGCEIARWQALAPLFGALGGSTGAV